MPGGLGRGAKQPNNQPHTHPNVHTPRLFSISSQNAFCPTIVFVWFISVYQGSSETKDAVCPLIVGYKF